MPRVAKAANKRPKAAPGPKPGQKPGPKGGGAQSSREEGDEAQPQETAIVSYKELSRLAGAACCPNIPVVKHPAGVATDGWLVPEGTIGVHGKHVDPRTLHASYLLGLIQCSKGTRQSQLALPASSWAPVSGLSREDYTPILGSGSHRMVRKLSSPLPDVFVGWDDTGEINDIQAFHLHEDFVALHQDLPVLALVKLEKQEDDHLYHIKEFGIDSERMHTVGSPHTVNLDAMDIGSADVFTMLDCAASRLRQIKMDGHDWTLVLKPGEKDFAEHLLAKAAPWLRGAQKEEQRPETPRTEAVDSSSDDCSSSGTEELEMREAMDVDKVPQSLSHAGPTSISTLAAGKRRGFLIECGHPQHRDPEHEEIDLAAPQTRSTRSTSQRAT